MKKILITALFIIYTLVATAILFGAILYVFLMDKYPVWISMILYLIVVIIMATQKPCLTFFKKYLDFD